jgi:hypothetical protein
MFWEKIIDFGAEQFMTTVKYENKQVKRKSTW